MNLYLIYQDINTGYDTFRSAVVVANSAKEAQNIHPDGRSGSYDRYDSWVSRPDLVEVIYFGKVGSESEDDAFFPKQSMYPGAVICSSFNAG